MCESEDTYLITIFIYYFCSELMEQGCVQQ